MHADTKRNNTAARRSCVTSLLLAVEADGGATTAGGLCVLALDAQAPVVAQTTVGPHLLEALQVLTKLARQLAGEHLGVATVLDIPPTVQEPLGDVEVQRVAQNTHQAGDLLLGQLAGTEGIHKAPATT